VVIPPLLGAPLETIPIPAAIVALANMTILMVVPPLRRAPGITVPEIPLLILGPDLDYHTRRTGGEIVRHHAPGQNQSYSKQHTVLFHHMTCLAAISCCRYISRQNAPLSDKDGLRFPRGNLMESLHL
jgi:hypothetical protein